MQPTLSEIERCQQDTINTIQSSDKRLNQIMETDITHFIENIPKVELHLHLEGTLEPSMLLSLAKRNGVTLPYMYETTSASVANAYKFTNLQSFLNLYYMGCTVLLQSQDFYDLTMAYLTRAHDENVRHVELFFDPQAHTARGVPFDDVVDGIHSALVDGERKYGISSKLIMCILRDQSEEDGMKALDAALRHKDKIAGVGLDSTEIGNPPSKFQRLFQRAMKEGSSPSRMLEKKDRRSHMCGTH